MAHLVSVRVNEVRAQHLAEVSIHDRWNVVELCDKSVLDPIDTPLSTEHHQTHVGRLRQPRVLQCNDEAKVGQILHDDDDEKDSELKSLDDITRRDLHQIVMIESLEHGALQLDEVVADE